MECFTVSDSKIAVTSRYMYLKKYASFIDRNIYVGKFVCLKNIDRLTIGKTLASIHLATLMLMEKFSSGIMFP